MTTKFELLDKPHTFGSARDAIDAASAFEADTLDCWEYHIVPGVSLDVWTVRAVCVTAGPRIGYLAPAATITSIGENRYRIEGPAGYCEFSVNQGPGFDTPAGGFLSSFGGSVWPDSFPKVFEALPSSAQLGSCRYRVRDLSALPEAAR